MGHLNGYPRLFVEAGKMHGREEEPTRKKETMEL